MIPKRIDKILIILNRLIDSLNKNIPAITVPIVPIPTQTA